MVLPYHILEAATDGDTAGVEAYLDDAGPLAVNEVDEEGQSLLMRSMRYKGENIQFARRMIERGADVNLCDPDEGYAPLHLACYPGDRSASMVLLLLQAGARVNHRAQGGLSPLGQLLEVFDYNLYAVDDEFRVLDDDEYNLYAAIQRQVSSSGLEIMELLLRNGASLDRCREDLSAEECMQAFLTDHPHYADDDYFTRCRELVAGVRAHGSWKAMCLAPLKDFLRLRSLLVRGRAKTDSRRLERLARLPNGACWHVLSFLRDAA